MVGDSTGNRTLSGPAFPPSHTSRPPQTHARQLVPAGSSNTCLAQGKPRAWQCPAAQREVYLPREPQNQSQAAHIHHGKARPRLRAPAHLQPSRGPAHSSKQVPGMMLGPSLALPCRLRPPPNWLCGFATFPFPLPTCQALEPALLRTQLTTLNLIFSASENPGIIKSQGYRSSSGLYLPQSYTILDPWRWEAPRS